MDYINVGELFEKHILPRLDIEVDDDTNTQKLYDIAEEAVAHLREFNPLLTDEDFTKPSSVRTLAVAYCRYAYSNAEDEFDQNYKSELLALRRRYEVESYAKSKEET